MKLSINKNFQKGFIKGGIPIILLALLLIGVVVFIFYNIKPSSPAPPAPPPTAAAVKTQVLSSPEQENAYGDKLLQTTPKYAITYIAEDDFILVTLLSSPISEARKAAEEELLQKSGNNLEGLCALKVDVAAPIDVVRDTGEIVENPNKLNICK